MGEEKGQEERGQDQIWGETRKEHREERTTCDIKSEGNEPERERGRQRKARDENEAHLCGDTVMNHYCYVNFLKINIKQEGGGLLPSGLLSPV